MFLDVLAPHVLLLEKYVEADIGDQSPRAGLVVDGDGFHRAGDIDIGHVEKCHACSNVGQLSACQISPCADSGAGQLPAVGSIITADRQPLVVVTHRVGYRIGIQAGGGERQKGSQ